VVLYEYIFLYKGIKRAGNKKHLFSENLFIEWFHPQKIKKTLRSLFFMPFYRKKDYSAKAPIKYQN